MAIRFPNAWAFGFVAYMLAMMATVYDGVLSLIFQPIAGAIYTTLACLTILLLGSPLLLTSAWNRWRKIWPVSLGIAISGVTAMMLSTTDAFEVQVYDEELDSYRTMLNPTLGLGGWLAMIFGILYMPRLALTKDGRWL